jgi:hypothetical protein
MVNVTVPLSYPAGTYNGTVNVSAQNDKFDTFTLEVNVLENRTWSMSPDFCQRPVQNPQGLVCEVNTTNQGNTQINFTVSPEQGNYTKVNETVFVVNRSGWHVFEITYNTTNAPPGIYNSTFIVDAVQTNSNPDNMSVRVSLIPFVAPIINISITPNETEQNATVKISVNVTDMSGSNIAWTKINITQPNGTFDSLNMSLINSTGNLTKWELTYPNGTNGSTIQRGIYNVNVYTKDNIGNEGNYSSSFLIYTKLNIILSTLSDRYYQGDTGSIYYVVRNFTNFPVQNISVNFTIIDSQGNLSYISSSLETNSDGTIMPMPSFTFASDTPLGNYTLISYTKYFDSVANKNLTIQKNYTFNVLSRTITVTGLFADVETAVVWYPPLPGYTTPIIRFGILVYNGEGRPVDPGNINLTVYRPDGFLYFSDSMSNMQKQATGYYIYQRSMLSDTPTGMYLAVVNVTQNEFQTLKLKAFRIATGGPYDVSIRLLENEVKQGGYLDFALTIENKGDVNQDVYLQYWISSQNTTYFTKSEAVLTPALSNQTFTRSAYIYSNQSLGNYLLNVKVIYDTSQPPIIVNTSFIVVTGVTPTYPPYTPPSISLPPTAAAVLPPTKIEKTKANIMISRYNSNISLARGVTKIESVIVNNSGEVDLEDAGIFLLGIPTAWFNVTPESYKVMKPGNSSVFLIVFTIPKNANPGEYGASLIATSGVVSDQKTISINILKSLEELLESDLAKLKEDFFNLQVDTKVAEKEGKDVTNVLIYIDEIKSKIDLIGKNLENNETEEALTNIATAKNLIEKANDVLGKLLIIRAKGLPWWIIAVVLFAVIVIAAVVIILWKKKKIVAKTHLISLKRLMEMVKRKEVNKEEMIKEKEKLLRMLKVVENERNEGIMSLDAYKVMKKTIEKKLSKVEEKIK